MKASTDSSASSISADSLGNRARNVSAGLRLILLHEGGADRCGHHRVLASRHMRQGIAHEVHTAALPWRTDHLRDRLQQPLMRIRDHHPDPGQATAQQVAQELRPESLGLGRTDCHAQRLAATRGIDADCNDDRLIRHRTSLPGLHVRGIQPDVRPLSVDLAAQKGRHPVIEFGTQLR
jgi:hypothetical protein